MVGRFNYAGPSGGVTQYQNQFKDIGWDDFDRISRQIGRARGETQNLRRENERVDAQLAAAKKQEKTLADFKDAKEKKDTADDAASVENSESFWAKIGDGSLEALQKTVDVLSRVDYGIANTVKENVILTPQNEAKMRARGFFETLGDEGASFKEGFTGKKKTLWADVIEKADRYDGEKDLPDWAVGTMGFAGDVFLDPTTYVGIGLIPKVAGRAIGLGKAVDRYEHGAAAIRGAVGRTAERGARGVGLGKPIDLTRAGKAKFRAGKQAVKDTAKSKIPFTGRGAKATPNSAEPEPDLWGPSDPTGDPETDDLVESIVGMNVKHETPDGNGMVYLTNEEVKGALGLVETGLGRATTKRDKVEQIRSAMDVIGSVGKRLEESPSVTATQADAIVEALTKRIDDLQNGFKGSDEVRLFGQRAYKEELQAMRDRGEYPDTPEPKTVDAEFEETVNRDRLTEMSSARINSREYKRQLHGTKKGTPRHVQLVKLIEDAENVEKRALGKWHNAGELEGFDHAASWEGAEQTARKYSTALSKKREDAMVTRLGDLRNQIKEAEAAGDETAAAAAREAQANTRKSLDGLRANLASATAEVYGSKIASHVTGSRLSGDPEFQRLARNLENTQSKDAQAALEHYVNTHPNAAKWREVRGDSSLSEEEQFNRAVENILPEERRKAEASYRRSNRKDRGNERAELKDATEGRNDGKPRIKMGDKSYTYAEFASIARKRKWTTAKDNAEANAANSKKAVRNEYTVEDFKPNEFSPNRREGLRSENRDVRGKDLTPEHRGAGKAEKRGTGENLNVVVKPETVAFNRLFKEQHGMNVQEFRKRWNEASEFQAAEKIKVDGKELTREQYVDKRAKDPVGKLSWRRSTDKVTKGDETLTRAQFKKKGGSDTQFDQHLREFARKNPAQHRKNLREQFKREAHKGRGREFEHSVGEGVKLSAKDQAAIDAQARKNAEQIVKSNQAHGKVSNTQQVIRHEFTVKGTGTKTVEDPEAVAVIQQIRDAEQKAKDLAKARQDKYANSPSAMPAGPTKDEINELYRERDRARQSAHESLQEHEKMVEERVDEQLLINLMHNTVDAERRAISINFGGKRVMDVSGPQWMHDTVGKVSELQVAKTAARIWADGFGAANMLEPELNWARIRMQSRTPELVHKAVSELKDKFGKYRPNARKASLRLYRQSEDPAVARDALDTDTAEFFDGYVKNLDGTVKIGDMSLTVEDVNRWLPEKFKMLPGPGKEHVRIRTGHDILDNMINLRETHDPLEIMWSLTMAREQAMATKNMQHVIRETFGVRVTSDNQDLADILIKQHGWEQSKEIPKGAGGEAYIFDRELKDQIDHLHDMLGTYKNVNGIIRLYDKALNIFKASVTVYNPGFYSRNGIGETLMGAMDGLYHPKHYKNAARVIWGFAKPDKAAEEVNAALKSMDPHKNWEALGRVTSGSPVAKLAGGRNISAEEAWVLYSEVGLRSGYVSSEYSTLVPSGGAVGALRASPPGQIMQKTNEAIRNRGEAFEDYFRMAHMLYRMEKSGLRDPLEAAQHAAGYVRKYHFDYTDFSAFEKTAMVRLFPFYKWTRKSLPLMVGTVFTSPGKALLYPKAMQNLSYSTGGTDVQEDTNGFNPNYETEVVPDWLRTLYAYPLFKDDAGNNTYFNVSTPQFDALKFAANPADASLNMLTPLVKAPIELDSGRTVTGDFEVNDKSEYASRQTPVSNFLTNTLMDNPTKKDIKQGNAGQANLGVTKLDPRTLSFMTGLGFYSNNNNRKLGELFSRVEREKDPKKQAKLYQLIAAVNQGKI